MTRESRAKVVLASIGTKATAAEQARFWVNANQIYKWKKEFIDNAALAFSGAIPGLRISACRKAVLSPGLRRL